jgi:hypothetical protein
VTRRARISTVAAGVLIGLGFAQLFPAQRINPPSSAALVGPRPVVATLRRACFDCHSNETRWPWYSHIAPLSWVIVNHVEEGRRELNFSEWNTYYPNTQRRKLRWMGRALNEEKMPPWYYRLGHPDARLSASDRTLLQRWIAGTLAADTSTQ